MLGTCQAEAAPKRAEVRGALSDDELRFGAAFTRIVSVLMRSIHYKHYSLSDLEWLVVPPVLAVQCAVLDAKINGKPVPVALALWASVSEEVDRRLSENLTAPAKLRPDEWRSGEILWLIDAVGDAKAIPHLLRGLQETAFNERDVKVRTVRA
jgi:cytolysin-activating lysine-acyltransferase